MSLLQEVRPHLLCWTPALYVHHILSFALCLESKHQQAKLGGFGWGWPKAEQCHVSAQCAFTQLVLESAGAPLELTLSRHPVRTGSCHPGPWAKEKLSRVCTLIPAWGGAGRKTLSIKLAWVTKTLPQNNKPIIATKKPQDV